MVPPNNTHVFTFESIDIDKNQTDQFEKKLEPSNFITNIGPKEGYGSQEQFHQMSQLLSYMIKYCDKHQTCKMYALCYDDISPGLDRFDITLNNTP